ncbi:MAG: Na(+)-translocating NADH-quinone reductase subunit C [Phycisphaerae bacterium]|nr:Na(+)-translocating NADH-quinone reductase subunit C [Phycisphaerae bacterium]
MSQDSTFKTIGVATGICLFCSLFVSVAAVKLSARQQENKQLDKIKNILQVADLADSDAPPMQIFQERIMPVLVDLATGKPVPKDQIDEKLDPNAFDVKALSGNPKYSHEIPGDQDLAGIKRQTNCMVVYLRKQGDTIDKVILPIYGKGLWSTLYGFLALEKDLETVSGITFYEHMETPGLGGEVDNPNWKSSWKGKQAFSPQGDKVIQVIKGQVNTASDAASHQIDGLSGATLTTRGVDNFIQFWLGDNGYGPFLKQLREAK